MYVSKLLIYVGFDHSVCHELVLLEKKTYDDVKQISDRNQNLRDRSLSKQRKQKKFHN